MFLKSDECVFDISIEQYEKPIRIEIYFIFLAFIEYKCIEFIEYKRVDNFRA